MINKFLYNFFSKFGKGKIVKESCQINLTKSKTNSRPLLKKKKDLKSHKIGLTKLKTNPVIMPREENLWESWQTFNPGAVLIDDKVHLVYRAMGNDGISRLGYAVSSDGFTIDDRFNDPVYQHKIVKRSFNIHSYFSGGSWGGAEDPRLVRVGDEDVIYLTYTACDESLRMGLSSIKIEDFVSGKWKWKKPVLMSPEGEINKNWLIFPEKINGKYAILHSIKPNIQIEYLDDLDFKNNYSINSNCYSRKQNKGWDKWLRGAGAPPIKTADGWLLFYHAMDDDWGKYKVGAMLLDLNDPSIILHKAKEPVLEPKESYENDGFKSGVVYVSGAVVKGENILIYYGCADSYVGVAYSNLDNFLSLLKQDIGLKLKTKIIKDKNKLC